jgi:hypothetical protein
MITLTPNLLLKKLDYRDPDYLDWGTIENSNMDICDLAFGTKNYTEQNYITNGESQSSSLDKIDIYISYLEHHPGTILPPDTIDALVGEGTPSISNKFVTKNYVRFSKKKVLYPEGAGTALGMSGSNNLGNMTNGSESYGDYTYNFYQWLGTEDSLQDYNISIQWKVPDTFSGFLTTLSKALIVDICTEEATTTNNKVDVTIKKDGTSTTSEIADKCSSNPEDWQAERDGTEVIGFDYTNVVLDSLVAGDILDITIRVYRDRKSVV